MFCAVFKGFVHIMAYFHQRIRTRIRIPNPIVILYYAQLFPLVQVQGKSHKILEKQRISENIMLFFSDI